MLSNKKILLVLLVFSVIVLAGCTQLQGEATGKRAVGTIQPIPCEGDNCKPQPPVQNPALCSDGTPFNECSANKPLFCDSNTGLTSDCLQCGCNANSLCNYSTGQCDAIPTCDANNSCASAGPNRYCENGFCIYRTCNDSDGGNFISIAGTTSVYVGGNIDPSFYSDTCADSGTVTEYSCTENATLVAANYNCANGCTNGACDQNGACTDGTPIGQCSNTLPLFCNPNGTNGTLENRCTQCGCDTNQICDTNTQGCIGIPNPQEPDLVIEQIDLLNTIGGIADYNATIQNIGQAGFLAERIPFQMTLFKRQGTWVFQQSTYGANPIISLPPSVSFAGYFDGLSNGEYYIEGKVDPFNGFSEENETNNQTQSIDFNVTDANVDQNRADFIVDSIGIGGITPNTNFSIQIKNIGNQAYTGTLSHIVEISTQQGVPVTSYTINANNQLYAPGQTRTYNFTLQLQPKTYVIRAIANNGGQALEISVSNNQRFHDFGAG